MKNPVLTFRSTVAGVKYGAKFFLKPTDPEDKTIDRFDLVAILAIEDILLLCEHVIELMNNPYAKNIKVIKEINDVKDVMIGVLKSIKEQKIPVGRACSEDNEEIDTIKEVLDGMSAPDCGDDGKSELLSSLIGFWLDEIKVRGNTILNLLTDPEDCWTYESSIKELRRLSYPPKYDRN